jgi:hypothetical protein
MRVHFRRGTGTRITQLPGQHVHENTLTLPFAERKGTLK